MGELSKPRFLCEECQKSFSRAEHLTRHSAIHNSTQTFGCEHCSKSFPRKDALNRHLLTHSGGPNLLERKARACRACAKAKTRCNGESPCARCYSKSIDCEFPDAKNHATFSPQHGEQGGPAIGVEQRGQDLNSMHRSRVSQPEPGNGEADSIRAMPAVDSPELTMSDYPVDNRESGSSPNGDDGQRFSPNAWTPTILSSLNWLPINPSPNFSYETLLSPLNIAHSPPFSQNQMGSAVLDPVSPGTNNMGTPVTHISNESLGHHSMASGESYIEGNAGRLPRIKRQKIIARRPSELRSRNFGWRLFWLPPISRIKSAGHHFAPFEYESMRNTFFNLCVNCNPVMTPFISEDFPSIEAFNHLMDLFFEHVHPSTPFVHRPTFNPDHEGRWILLLSMVSTSSWFLDDQTSDDFAESMLEFLRRVTLFYDSSNLWQKTFTNCRQAQIRLLFLLSASASRDEAVKTWSDRCMGELCYLVNTSICQSYPKAAWEPAGLPIDAEWIAWTEHEQTIRTAFLVWQIGLLRSMQNTDGRSPVSLDSISRIRLPCTDAMFEAADADSWQTIEVKSSQVTFQEALQNLYIDKRLMPGLGDFSHILLVYGVVQRTREVQDLVRQPMSLIEPSAERRSSSSMAMQQAEWPASVPLFLKWRNSACDCLDILHWQANAAIGMAGGLEPTKVLHLHLARVLMLVPLQDLFTLARLINFPFRSMSAQGSSPPEELELRRNIQRWAMSDQYKARLAAIHAGVTFWHVRRYSQNAHYEVLAVLSATLTLWALSVFSPRMPYNAQSPDTASMHGSDDCSIILIDRPTDDELVQQFVRQGQTMRATMSGVDNLWSSTAPYRILVEGRRLLASLGAWTGEMERAAALIDGLISASIREV